MADSNTPRPRKSPEELAAMLVTLRDVEEIDTDLYRGARQPGAFQVQLAHQILGRIHQLEQIRAVHPAFAGGGGDKHFQGRIARAGTHAGQGRIDADRAVLHGDDGVGHAQREVVVRMHAALGLGLQHAIKSLEAGGHAVHVARVVPA